MGRGRQVDKTQSTVFGNFRLTGEICLIAVQDPSREDGFRHVDLGNYYETKGGQKVLITTVELARRYGHLVDVPVFVRREGVGLL